MDQQTAKRLYVSALTSLDQMIDADKQVREWFKTHTARPVDDAEIDQSEIMDEVGEELWHCQDVIDAPASALEMIGLEPGATFHDAVLIRALSWLFDGEGPKSGETEREALHAIFLKAEPEPHDRETFDAWLRTYADLEPEC